MMMRRAMVLSLEKSREEQVLEVRPGGMLVQKRDPDSELPTSAAPTPAPTIRVKVKYESSYQDIYISSQATFGELKKLVADRTGLHPQDQKIVFRERDRESREYLDTAGVKDGTKLTVSVDPIAHAKRLLEARRVAKAQRAAKSVSAVATEVDKLVSKVSALETIVSKGNKVADKDVLDLTEQLMNQLLKLDNIAAEGDVKIHSAKQVKRVQKYVETLDVLKIKNAKISMPMQQQQQKREQQPSQSAMVTTEWEVFDSLCAASNTTSTASTTPSTATPKFDWELF